MTNTRNAPTPDASEGVATPPYKTYKTPTTINKNGSTLGITSNFSLSVGGVPVSYTHLTLPTNREV